MITIDTASRFARLTLRHIGQEYPNMLQHMLAGPEDALTPSALHPIFYGSFDWHSCVHGWWQLLTLLRLYPDMAPAADIRVQSDEMLVPAKHASLRDYVSAIPANTCRRAVGYDVFQHLTAEDSLDSADLPGVPAARESASSLGIGGLKGALR